MGKVCAARAGSAWVRRGLGAPNSTLWCLWGRGLGNGAWLFPAVPGERGGAVASDETGQVQAGHQGNKITSIINHGIIERLGLEGTLKFTLFQPP